VSEQPAELFQVVVCGLPGTLKTFLSARIAHRLGALWLPTVSLAAVTVEPTRLASQRMARYRRCLDALRLTAGIGARVVVEGGFSSMELKRDVFASYPDCAKILIECIADTETRLARLQTRSLDDLDTEQASAQSIVQHGESSLSSVQFGDALAPQAIACSAVIVVDTSNFGFKLRGNLDASLEERISAAIRTSLEEYRVTTKLYPRAGLTESFKTLAASYEESTEWRMDPTLMAHLQVDLPCPASDVVDIGSGTGLAARWYSDQGHRCVGVDISPHMSSKAAPRVLFTNFGSATDLPFFDASFDLALMRQMLHYTEPVLALREARRVLRPTGKLIVASAIAPSAEVKSVWEVFKSATQPLRLRVFSEMDLVEMVSAEGFDIAEVRRATLLREEALAKLAHRASEPACGWTSFMSRMEKAFATLAPSLEFRTTQDGYSYQQFWITVVARNRTKRVGH